MTSAVLGWELDRLQVALVLPTGKFESAAIMPVVITYVDSALYYLFGFLRPYHGA